MDVIDWLMDSDPAIRWQVLRDLLDASPDEVAAERARVAREGWGARLLGLQDADGRWDGGTYRPGWADESRPFFDAWTAMHFSLQQLHLYGVDPDDPAVRAAVARVREVEWGEEDGGGPIFAGTPEPCMSGVLLGYTVHFGEDGSRTLQSILDTQLPDGGWNCETDTKVSSFHSTICVLEGLLAWERAAATDDPRLAQATAARRGGEEYLLERRLLWRMSTGEFIDPRFTMPSYPTRWFYDVLRGLDHLRSARPEGDPRAADAIELLRAKRRADGRWAHENTHEGPIFFRMGEREGVSNRWVTLHALRVLRWADATR